MVTEFHDRFGCAIAQSPSRDLRTLRARLIAEEADEANNELARGDLASIAKELADLAYVTYGAAISLGIDLDAAIAAVHDSNMSKLGADGKPIMREDGKVLKGPDYRAPDMSLALWPAIIASPNSPNRQERAPTMTTETTMTIAITQDYEFDEDCGLGGSMLSFWTEGHGHDPEQFIRAVIDHTLEEHGSVARIELEDKPVEMWQRTIDRGDGVEYSRQSTAPDGSYPRAEPITLLDLERHSRGGTKCGVVGCVNPWSSGPAAVVRVEIDGRGPTVNNSYMAVRMWFCREHTRQFPEPSYRVCMVPVGATIMLPTPAAIPTEVTQ